MKTKHFRRRLKNLNGAEFISEYFKYYSYFEINKKENLKNAFEKIGTEKGIDLKSLNQLIKSEKIKSNGKHVVLN